jgi:hypothetical protein
MAEVPKDPTRDLYLFTFYASIGLRHLTCSPHPDRLWGPLNLQPNGCQRLFFRGINLLGRKLDHSFLLPRFRRVLLTFDFPFGFMVFVSKFAVASEQSRVR